MLSLLFIPATLQHEVSHSRCIIYLPTVHLLCFSQFFEGNVNRTIDCSVNNAVVTGFALNDDYQCFLILLCHVACLDPMYSHILLYYCCLQEQSALELAENERQEHFVACDGNGIFSNTHFLNRFLSLYVIWLVYSHYTLTHCCITVVYRSRVHFSDLKMKGMNILLHATTTVSSLTLPFFEQIYTCDYKSSVATWHFFVCDWLYGLCWRHAMECRAQLGPVFCQQLPTQHA